MSFAEWLKANGFGEELELQEPQLKVLRASFDAEIAATEGGGDPDDEADDDEVPSAVNAAESQKAIKLVRAGASDELKRIRKIRGLFGEKHVELCAKAVEAGWSFERAENAFLKKENETIKASRPNLGSITAAGASRGLNSVVIECAMRMASNVPEAILKKDYDDKTLELAWKHRRLTYRGIIQAALAIEGKECPSLTASDDEWIRAGFSTTSLSGILGATINRTMLSAYEAQEQLFAQVALSLSANDFKTHTGYQMHSEGIMPEVGQDGELKSITLEESAFPYRVKTFGEMVGLTRQQFINDDLGAFTQLPAIFGRRVAATIEYYGWALVMGNSGSFFSAANKNYIEGASTNLSLSTLSTLVKTMREQKGKDKKSLRVSPWKLIVPPALEEVAQQLYISDNLIATGVGSSRAVEPSSNIYKGRFAPHVVPEIADKPKEHYLVSNPALGLAAFGLAFLNGMNQPTMEEKEPAPEFLGRMWRVYIDFGVCFLQPQAVVKSKGEA